LVPIPLRDDQGVPDRFGLKDLHDLPKIEDMAEALGFDPPAGLMETTPREDMLRWNEGEPESEKLEGQS
jgi:hypothetical protein